jgi:FKBP-type peptidyl-prolyl cis-trans isomerase FklB
MMKSLVLLLLAAGLMAGCSPKADDSDPKVAGAAFLAANAKKPGVITTPSGLQYLVLKSGTGPSPKLTDKVTVNYEGRLLDGTIFDSSIERAQPATFPVNGVISGWTEALQMMKVGDQWQLFVPANLAYGDQSPGASIPANSVLIFKVELLDIPK